MARSLSSLNDGRPEVSLIVPGRGEPCGPEAVSSLIAYLQRIMSITSQNIAEGKRRQDLVDHVPELLDYFPSHFYAPDWSQREIALGLERAFDQLLAASDAVTGNAPGSPLFEP